MLVLQAAMMSRLLTLQKMMVKNASFVCCCLLNLTSFRLQTIGFYAACSVLESKFNLQQFGSHPMSGFFTELPNPEKLLETYVYLTLIQPDFNCVDGIVLLSTCALIIFLVQQHQILFLNIIVDFSKLRFCVVSFFEVFRDI